MALVTGSKVARSMLINANKYRHYVFKIPVGAANSCHVSQQLVRRTLCSISSSSDTGKSEEATTSLLRNTTNEQLDQIRRHIQREELFAAENLLLQLNSQEMQTYSPIFFFNQLLGAYANSGQVQKLLSLFRKLLDDPVLPCPDEFSLNVCLKVLPYDQAYGLLRKRAVQDLAKTTAFNTVIAISCKNKEHKIAINLLEIMIERGLEPDNFTITPIIELLGKIRKAPKAQRLFERMIDRGLVPDLIMWTALLHCWAISKRHESAQRTIELLNKMQQHFDVEPDTVAYNAVLLALANDLNRGKQAEQLLSVMTAAPNVISYSTCILAWNNSPDLPEAVEHSETLLKDMEKREITPNAILWSSMISLYARRGIVHKAEDTLKKIERPNVIVYTSVIEAWANSNRVDAFENALILLERMETKPNVRTFNTLVKVVERNPGPKAKSLMQIKQMWEKARIQPNIRTYNAMYGACSAAAMEDKDESLLFMLEIYEEMQCAQIPVDNYTFPSVFKALANLKAPFEKIDQFFQQCIAARAVSRMVISHLKRSCSMEQLRRLLPVQNVYNFGMEELPSEWTGLNNKLRRKQREGRR